MSVYDFLHNFFGNNHGAKGRPPEFQSDDDHPNSPFNRPNSPGWNSPAFIDEEFTESFPSMFDFKIISDPFEMHRFINEKVNEMMKSFILLEEMPGFQKYGSEVPAITEKQDFRDHYLKPGVKKPTPSEKSEDERSSSTTSWMDKLIPTPNQKDPHSFSSFSSVIRKTVRLPDGTVKTEEIIRNSDGSEERTESHSMSDGNITPVFPDFSGLYKPPTMPEIKDPRYQFLKPGYEKPNPHGEKIDKDLDKQIEQSGIESLPSFTKEPEVIYPNINQPVIKSFNFTKRVVTLPSGVVESEEIIRNPDGSEQRTVTHTMPDGAVNDSSTSSIGGNKEIWREGYDKTTLSFALRGVRDFVDMLFK